MSVWAAVYQKKAILTTGRAIQCKAGTIRRAPTLAARATLCYNAPGWIGRPEGSVYALQNIVLIGMPGSGKSTVGVLLAKRLGMRFLDTDLLLIEQTGVTLPQLLRQQGVEGFLTLEGAMGEALHCEHTVIATGGSMVLSAPAMENLCKLAFCVWLDTPLPFLQARIDQAADRGIAAGPGVTLAQIDAVRRPLYEHYQNARVDGALGVEAVVRAVLDTLRERSISF